MSTISLLNQYQSGYGGQSGSGGNSVSDLLQRLNVTRQKLVKASQAGQVGTQDAADIAKRLKLIDDALRNSGVNGTLTGQNLNDLAGQITDENRKLTSLVQGKSEPAEAPAKTKAELLERIQKLRGQVAGAIKSGAIVGDTAKGLVQGVASIQTIYAKYDAKGGAFSSTQLSDLSALVSQAHGILHQRSQAATNPLLDSTNTNSGTLSLVNFLT